MERAFLCTERGHTSADRVPVDGTVTIGRAADCELVVDDAAVSRRHISLEMRNGVCYWRDLGSTNGAIVNGALMQEGRLEPGDLIQIGETLLRFEMEEEAEGVPPVEILQRTTLDRHGVSVDTGQGQTVDRAESLLRAAYNIMNELASDYDPCRLVDRILVTTLEAVKGQHGAVLFGKEEDTPGACPTCGYVHTLWDGALQKAAPGHFRISQTVASHVLRDGKGVLYQDTDTPMGLNPSESMMALKLKSIICVPLRGKYGVFGVLYIDTDRPGQQYTQEDLLLTTAAGNSAGLALENAQMHQDILEKQRMDHEIETAWSIQEGFLVKTWPDKHPHVEVYGETQPAKVVGGDFYDFVEPGPGRAGILIGDVSGKGVPAALTMARLLAEFRIRVLEEPSPSAVLQALNTAQSSRQTRGIFCTMAYVELDVATGKLRCANAGHHAPIVLGAEDVWECGHASGPPVGVLPEFAWSEGEAQLAPGEMVLLYTDGVIEARQGGPVGEAAATALEYGEAALMAFARSRRQAKPKEFAAELLGKVGAHCSPGVPHDDCTLIAMRYLGP